MFKNLKSKAWNLTLSCVKRFVRNLKSLAYFCIGEMAHRNLGLKRMKEQGDKIKKKK